MTILLNSAPERYWNRIGFSDVLRLARKDHPDLKRNIYPGGKHLHGLRKASASLPAEFGRSPPEIAAIIGYMTLKIPKFIQIGQTGKNEGTRPSPSQWNTDGKHREFDRQPVGNICLLQIETKVDLGFHAVLWHTTLGNADGAAPTPEESPPFPAVMS